MCWEEARGGVGIWDGHSRVQQDAVCIGEDRWQAGKRLTGLTRRCGDSNPARTFRSGQARPADDRPRGAESTLSATQCGSAGRVLVWWVPHAVSEVKFEKKRQEVIDESSPSVLVIYAGATPSLLHYLLSI